jgi:hypothetical protein
MSCLQRQLVCSGDTLACPDTGRGAGACGISRTQIHHREPPEVEVLAQKRLAGAVHVTNTFVIASKD